jgi:uncharacterized protein (DUF305 family)
MYMKFLVLALILFAVAGAGACGKQGSPNDSDARRVSNTTNGHNDMKHSTTQKHEMNHGSMDHSSMVSSEGAADAPYDLQFLDTMIVHHQGAVDMASDVESKAEHPELKALARNIITSQEKEIGEMKAWREKWFPDAAPAINMEMAGMSDSMKDMDMTRLNSLTGSAFDLEFVKQMIPHHEGAVVMAKEVLDRSQKAEIRNLATSIIRDQEAEIKQMRDWQAAWQ